MEKFKVITLTFLSCSLEKHLDNTAFSFFFFQRTTIFWTKRMCTSFPISFSQRPSEAGELLFVIHFATEST